MIYLASPHAHPDPAVREARERAAAKYTIRQFQCGLPLYSPIVYSAAIAAHNLPWDFWMKFDRPFLKAADRVWVLMLDGWKESKGVQAEIGIARKLGKHVAYVEE